MPVENHRAASLLPYALELAAQHGWRCHPLRPNEKLPILKAWPERATADESKIQELWAEHPAAGIGVACGKASNLVVIDIDTPKGGDDSLVKLCERYGVLPDTLTSRTGGGGRQLFFRYPNNCDVRNKARLDKLPGVDVRGEGGYVVAPPSIHPSGKPYEWAGTVQTIADLPSAWVRLLTAAEPTATAPATQAAPGLRATLRNVTMSFIASGADEGERNTRLAHAALEMAGGGYPIDEARKRLWLGAELSRPPIERAEFEATLASAYSRPRTPYVDPQDVELGGKHYEPDTISPEKICSTNPHNSQARNESATLRKDATACISNVQFSNQRTGPDAEDEYRVTLARPIGDIAASIREATGDEPRVVQSALFAVGEYDPSTIPGKSAIRFLADENTLFAWLHERTIVYWITGAGKGGATHVKKRDAAMTPVRRREIFEHLRDDNSHAFTATDVLPHVPAVRGIFYAPLELPAATGVALAELAERLNPASELDRKLLIAALLTPGWGGSPGSRPAFVFGAERPGAGKSKTAEFFAELWGGYISLSPNIRAGWERFSQALLSDSGMAKRIVIIGNVKGKLSSEDLEDAISTRVINGHKLHHGHFSRPNLLTWYITANTPSLGHDLAERAVEIRLGEPQDSKAAEFERWLDRFLADNRAQLIADVLGRLAGERYGSIRPENRDRWANWQDGVLCCFEDADELAALIKSRRAVVDQDTKDAEDAIVEIEAELTKLGHFLDAESVVIPVADMRDILQRRGVYESKSTQGATTWLKNRLKLNAALGSKLSHKNSGGTKGSGRHWLYQSNESAMLVDIKKEQKGYKKDA